MTVMAHRTEVWSNTDGTFGWVCFDMACRAERDGMSSHANAELEAHNHGDNNWGRG